MAITVTENFPELFVLEDKFIKMAFYRERCTLAVNVIAELKPVFKNRRKHFIQWFTNEKNIIYDSLGSKL